MERRGSRIHFLDEGESEVGHGGVEGTNAPAWKGERARKAWSSIVLKGDTLDVTGVGVLEFLMGDCGALGPRPFGCYF